MNETAAMHNELAHDAAGPGLIGLAERGLLPDALLRYGIRRQCEDRLKTESGGGLDAQAARESNDEAKLQCVQLKLLSLERVRVA